MTKPLRPQLVILGLLALFASTAAAQTGTISGKITDQDGSPVNGAKVIIVNKATGQAATTSTTSTGIYASAPLPGGDYTVQVERRGFYRQSASITVQVDSTAAGDFKLQKTGLVVATDQVSVQGIVNSDLIENLPVNGRNFLDLAQLEPGVQIQDGSTFDPTKNGFTSISFEGRFGRAARIEVDGADISDETVGTTTQNLPLSSIAELHLSQSLLDLSTGLTSSGAVNVITRSGSDSIHGEAFGLFRGDQLAARLPGSTPSSFQREQFGGRLGGSLIKDKLFWFVDGERAKQDLTTPQSFSSPFDSLNTSLSQPFRETQAEARLDWQLSGSTHLFYRFNFDQNSQIRAFGLTSSLQDFRNFNHTPSHAVGIDFKSGAFTHSVRFSLLEFRNSIIDATGAIPAGNQNPIPGLGVNIGAAVDGMCVSSGGGSYCGGPSLLAPQATAQSNHQIKYDGSRALVNHTLRFGVAFNHIRGGGFAGFFSFPQVGTTFSNSVQSDPASYPIQYAALGNGIGFSTPSGAFGYRGGGLGPDNRFETYAGDAWKIKPNLTLNYGVRYVHDTGRVDSDLGALPVLNNWGPGLGKPVRTPGLNFAPQVGVAWDPGRNGNTVLRAGGGLFFDNSIWNNLYFDSPARRADGMFAATPFVCFGGNANPFPWPTDPGALGTSVAAGAGTSNGNGTVSPTFCNQAIATAGSSVIALSNAFKAAASSNTASQPNANFVGTTLNAANLNGFDLFNPNYRSPRSWHMNLGFEHEIRPGMVFSADYSRNIGEHFLIAVDQNHSGAARSFNLANAIAARDKAQIASGCPVGPGQATCMITNNGGQFGAQSAYSSAGLDSNIQTLGGAPCSFCAFPGVNPVSGNSGAVGTLDMLSPAGRSVYNGVQLKLVQRIATPFRSLKAADLQFAYTRSKFVSQALDQDFVTLATNNDNPTQFTGPNGLDRKHQVSFGGTFDFPFFTRISMIAHFSSALPQSLFLPTATSGGEIFATDWLGSGLGSGSAGEPVPGTQIGQFQRETTSANLQTLINNYNSKFAGTLTPAGSQLVNNNVMNNTDMTQMGWIMPQLPSVASGAQDFGWLKTFDLKGAWPIRVKERLTVEPSVSIFNLFNFANGFLGGKLPLAQLTPANPTCFASGTCASATLASNVVGGVTNSNMAPFRAGLQSGTYALGAPRQIELGLKITF